MVIEIIIKGTLQMRKYIFVAALAIVILSLQACSGNNNTQKTDASGSATQQMASTTPQAEQNTPVTTTKPAQTTKPVQTTKPTTTTTPQSTTTTQTKQPEPTATTTTTPPQATVSAKGNITNGATVYKKNCAGCHGNTGEGNGPAASSLKPKPANFVATDYKDSKGKNPRDYTDAEALDIINNGRKGTAMPAWKKQLSAEQINDVLAYIRSLEK